MKRMSHELYLSGTKNLIFYMRFGNQDDKKK